MNPTPINPAHPGADGQPPPVDPASGDRLDHAEALIEHFERLETRFDEVRRHLTRSHRLTTLGTLASIIAHEYNNILTPIVSYAQMSLADPDNKELMRKAVEKSLAGAERAAKISSSLLGFSREHDRRQTAPLRQTIDEAVATLARPPERDGIALTVDVPEVELAIDPLSLQQVLVNLLLNARKAMRRTGGAVTIRAELLQVPTPDTWSEMRVATANERQPPPTATPGNPATSEAPETTGASCTRLHLTFTDTGPGIPDAVRDRLFEPFVTQSVERDTPGEEKGTGLGLCICRDLVAAAGGTIHAESIPAPEPNHGATFHLELPVAAEGGRGTEAAGHAENAGSARNPSDTTRAANAA